MLTSSRPTYDAMQLRLSGLPRQLIVGLLLVSIAWPTAWFGPDQLAQHTFFPLWFGYILAVDGIVERRTSTSLLRRSRSRFAALFVISIPLWWMYEAFNARLGNWEYLLSHEISPLDRRIRASVAFSTVVPALFETAEFYRSTGLARRFGRWRRLAPSRSGLVGFSLFGATLVAASLLFPNQAFPLIWIGLFFVCDPLVNLAGGRSISAQVARGRWDTVVALFLAGITCGLFWEGWNYWSDPKWIYHIPYVGQPKLFEMPILGYGGYLPFALEVYATVRLLDVALRVFPDRYLRFDEIIKEPENRGNA